MSEQNRYVNAYIDHAVGMLHENLTQILQTKTQLRVANELVAEKDKLISSLQAELEQNKSSLTDKNSAVQNAQKWEAEYNAMKNKVSHMDTLLHQMNDMKKLILEKNEEYNKMMIVKDEELEKLRKKLIDIQSSKKTINRKKTIIKPIVEETQPVVLPEETQTVMPVVVPVVNEQLRETDDF